MGKLCRTIETLHSGHCKLNCSHSGQLFAWLKLLLSKIVLNISFRFDQPGQSSGLMQMLASFLTYPGKQKHPLTQTVMHIWFWSLKFSQFNGQAVPHDWNSSFWPTQVELFSSWSALALCAIKISISVFAIASISTNNWSTFQESLWVMKINQQLIIQFI